MQSQDTGQMTYISRTDFDKKTNSYGSLAPVIRVDDIFKIRGCHFRLTGIDGDKITAVGISRKDYFDARRSQRF